MRISDWSSDVCSSDLLAHGQLTVTGTQQRRLHGVSRAGAAQATLLTQDDGVRMLGARCPERLLLYVVAGAQPGSQQRGVIEASQPVDGRSEEHTSELQSLMRISYAVFCLKKKKQQTIISTISIT